MSYAEDMGYDAYDIPESLEESWLNGVHKTKTGEVIRLYDMEVSHLKNTIKYFTRKGLNTTPLVKILNYKLIKQI